jgi:hypothetical protein
MFLGGFSHGKGEQPEKPDETPETESKEHVASIPEHGYHRTSLDSNRDEMRSVHSADKSNSMTSHSDRVESDHVNGSNHTHDNVHRTQHNSRNFHNRL